MIFLDDGLYKFLVLDIVFLHKQLVSRVLITMPTAPAPHYTLYQHSLLLPSALTDLTTTALHFLPDEIETTDPLRTYRTKMNASKVNNLA